MQQRDLTRNHRSQLDVLNLSYPLREALREQLCSTFEPSKDVANGFDVEHAMEHISSV